MKWLIFQIIFHKTLIKKKHFVAHHDFPGYHIRTLLKICIPNLHIPFVTSAETVGDNCQQQQIKTQGQRAATLNA